MILTVALVAPNLSIITRYTVCAPRHCICVWLQCLLLGPYVAVFRLDALLLCRAAGGGSGKWDRLFCLMKQVTREFGRNTHSIPHPVNTDWENQKLCFFSLSQFPLLSFYGNNYHSGQQICLITSMNLFFVFLKGRCSIRNSQVPQTLRNVTLSSAVFKEESKHLNF